MINLTFPNLITSKDILDLLHDNPGFSLFFYEVTLVMVFIINLIIPISLSDHYFE